MNIEESIEILKNMILMPDGWIIGKNYKGNLEFIGCPEGQEAIETLLTAYEKEKEKNKKAIDFINDKNNYFEDGENWQNVLKIKHILEE